MYWCYVVPFLYVQLSGPSLIKTNLLTSKSEVAQANNDDLTKQVNKLLSILPKFSGYIQTGYNWGDKNGDNRSSFQLKRMRLIIDKKVSKTFDFRAQLECFSGSVDNSAYKKKVITVMDAFVNAHITDALHFRAGQYYLPLGFENYDISPSTFRDRGFLEHLLPYGVS